LDVLPCIKVYGINFDSEYTGEKGEFQLRIARVNP
jgi:hypothetical protein